MTLKIFLVKILLITLTDEKEYYRFNIDLILGEQNKNSFSHYR